MKLTYFKDPKGNFGDDLNPWLWSKLLPDLLDDDPAELLIGVGTILEPWFAEKLASEARKIVIGSGSGMSIPPLQLDTNWSVVCVRGPLTAAYLGIDASFAATDPAMCIRDLWPRPENPTGKVGFMPHYGSLLRWDWRKTCDLAGLEFVDPCGDTLTVLDQIANLRLLLTEAMHGAIVADALRVPWFPLQISPTNYVGKWHDWSASIGMPVHFMPLPFLYDPLKRWTIGALMQKGARHTMHELRRRSSSRQHHEAVSLLTRYGSGYDGYLSDDRNLDRAISRFRDMLHDFQTKRAGSFSPG